MDPASCGCAGGPEPTPESLEIPPSEPVRVGDPAAEAMPTLGGSGGPRSSASSLSHAVLDLRDRWLQQLKGGAARGAAAAAMVADVEDAQLEAVRQALPHMIPGADAMGTGGLPTPRVWKWDELQVGYRNLPPFRQPMPNGGMSGWMPRLDPDGPAPPDPAVWNQSCCECECEDAAGREANARPQAAEAAQRQIADLIEEVRRVVAEAGEARDPAPAVPMAPLPAAAPVAAAGRADRGADAVRRILDKLNENLFEIQSWVSSGGGGGSTSLPTTTKGDLVVHNGTTNVRLPVGSNTQVLTADSAQSTGVKWAASGATIDLMDVLRFSSFQAGYM